MSGEAPIKKYYEGVPLESMRRSLFDRYLTESGWVESAAEKMPLRAGEPVPWYTYSAIAFLEAIVEPHFRVFEFGAGNSTLYWEKRVREVVSVEHDPVFVAYLRSNSMGKAKITLLNECGKLDKNYIDETVSEAFPDSCNKVDIAEQIREEGYLEYGDALSEFAAGDFDIAIVDGPARTLSALNAGLHMRDGGLVLLDNSDRPESATAIALLVEMGFRRIDFWGLGPVNPYGWCTTLFFKDGAEKPFF